MTDTQSAGLVVIIGSIGFALWYRSRSEAQRSALVSGGQPPLPSPNALRPTLGLPFPTPNAQGPRPTGSRILSEAEKSLGESTYRILPQYPRRACATFVSDVLARVGLIRGCYPGVQGLETALGAAGAERVAYGASLTEQGALKPGDILLFAGRRGLGHTAIYAGGGEVIGTSSEEKHVREQPLTAFGGTYKTYEAFRFR